MEADEFSRHIEIFRERLEALTSQEDLSRQQSTSFNNETLGELSALLEALQVADAELREQNEELTGTRETLEREHQRYRDLFEFAPDGYLLTDLSGKIIEYNQVTARLLNIPVEFLVGKPLAAYIYIEDRREFRRRLTELARGDFSPGGNRIEDWELRLQPRSNPPFYIQVTVAAGREDGELRWMLRDIRRRKAIQAELAEVQRRLAEGRELERIQLAQELHDGPVQDLYGVAFRLNTFSPPDGNKAEIEGLQTTLHAVINTLRSICSELRPPTLAPFGLEKAIHSHVGSLHEEHPELSLHLELAHDGTTLPENVRLTLFRIYQQAMTNVLRHAHAREVWVRLALEDSQVWLEVEDDGLGFEVPERWAMLALHGKLGLVGSAERAKAIGGSLQVTSAPDQGTKVRASAPLQA
jgi:PAS domain S-box-containing protein